tara:strand:- start:986 stop:1852 length:867 start_codon:yes stop_codon:yes gene_type:complete
MAKKKKSPLTKAIKNRIDLANEYIKFAIKHDIRAVSYFGGTWPTAMTFSKLISVSPAGNIATIEYKQNDGIRTTVSKSKYDLRDEFQVSDMRYEITQIINGIKKGAKEDGWKLSHSGSTIIAERNNPRRKYGHIPHVTASDLRKKKKLSIPDAMDYLELIGYDTSLIKTPYTLKNLMYEEGYILRGSFYIPNHPPTKRSMTRFNPRRRNNSQYKVIVTSTLYDLLFNDYFNHPIATKLVSRIRKEGHPHEIVILDLSSKEYDFLKGLYGERFYMIDRSTKKNSRRRRN